MAVISAPVAANAADWQLNGVAAFSGSTDLRLTPTGNWQVGNAVFKTPVTADGLAVAFEMEASGGSGADGFSFSFFDPAHTTTTSIGGNGANLGTDNIRGVHVRYEYWSGINTVSIRTVDASGQVDSNVVSPVSSGIHEVALWLARTGPNAHNLTLVIDGTVIFNAIPTEITDQVRFALGAATGGADDNHYIRNFGMTSVATLATGSTLSGAASVQEIASASLTQASVMVSGAIAGFAHLSTTSTLTTIPVTDPYVLAVLKSGPIGYWRLTESGPVYKDASGHGHDLTLAGGSQTPTVVPGPVGAAQAWASGPGHAESTQFTKVAGTSSEVWVYLPDYPSANLTPLGQTNAGGNGTSGRQGIFTAIDPTGHPVAVDAFTGYPAPNPLTRRAWHHLVSTISSGSPSPQTTHVYVDAQLVYTTTALQDFYSDTNWAAFLRGAGSGWAGTDAIIVAEPAIYARELSAAEVLAHYRAAPLLAPLLSLSSLPALANETPGGGTAMQSTSQLGITARAPSGLSAPSVQTLWVDSTPYGYSNTGGSPTTVYSATSGKAVLKGDTVLVSLGLPSGTGPVLTVTGYGGTWYPLAVGDGQEVWAVTASADFPGGDAVQFTLTGTGYFETIILGFRGLRAAAEQVQVETSAVHTALDHRAVTLRTKGDVGLFFSHSLSGYVFPQDTDSATWGSRSAGYNSYSVVYWTYPNGWTGAVPHDLFVDWPIAANAYATISLALRPAYPLCYSSSALGTAGRVSTQAPAGLHSSSALGLGTPTITPLVPLHSTSTLGSGSTQTYFAAAALHSTSLLPVTQPPTFVSASSVVSPSGSATVAAPTGLVVNNLLIAALFSGDVSGQPFTVTLPPGWHWALPPERSAPSGAFAVAYHYVTGAEPSTYAFTSDYGLLSVLLAQYANPAPINPIDVVALSQYDTVTSASVPQVTASGTDALLALIGSKGGLSYTASGSLTQHAFVAGTGTGLTLLDQPVPAGLTPALTVTPSSADSGTVVALALRGGDSIRLATSGAAALASTSALGAAYSVSGAAALTSTSVLTVAGSTSRAGAASLHSTSALPAGAGAAVRAAAVLRSFSLLHVAATVQRSGAAALASTSVLTVDGGVGQGLVALASTSTLVVAGAVVRDVGVALHSHSTLAVAGRVPPTGVAALRSTSRLVVSGGVPGAITALTATVALTPITIAYNPSQANNLIASGNPATGGGLLVRVTISPTTLEQAVLPDWLPGTIQPGTLVDPGSPGVPATYTDPVYIPPVVGPLLYTPGTPPSPVSLASQFVPLRRVSEIYHSPTLDTRGRPINWQPANVVVEDIGYYQVLVAHRDVTVLGGVPVQVVSLVEHEPFGYATADLRWPGVTGFQRVGAGAPSPLSVFTPGAPVEVRLINPEVSLTAYTTLFEGELATLDDENDNKSDPMAWTIMGFLFRADLQLEAPRIVPITAVDIGTAIPRLLNGVVNRTWSAMPTVKTGIPSYRRGSWQPILTGGVQDMLSTATTSDGKNQWTVKALPGRRVRMTLKDVSTVNWTVRWGQRGVVTRLRLDFTQFANAIYGEGTDPNGLIWRNSKYPNLHIAPVAPYPGHLFFPGGSATGFLPLADLLRRHGYPTMVSQDTYLAADEDEIRRAQQAAGVQVDGIVGPQTWVALFGIGTDAESLSGARIDPLVIDPHVQPYLFGANGSIIGRNPALNPTALRVDRFEEFGEGIFKIDGIRSAKAEYLRDHVPGYVGTIDLTSDPNEGSRRLIRAGGNIVVQNHRGVDRKLHIAGVSLSEAGNTPAVVSLDVSEKPVDLLTLAAIKSRNKDNTDPARRRLLAQRTSRTFNDQIVAWDSESGAGIIPPHPLYGGLWTVIRIPAGGYATIVETIFHTRSPKSEFAVGVFAQKVTAAQLQTVVGNPLAVTTSGASPWINGSTKLLNMGWVIGWGENASPCGYSPSSKGSGPLTGDLIDKGSWEFQSASVPWMWIAEWSAHSTTISGQLRAAILQ